MRTRQDLLIANSVFCRDFKLWDRLERVTKLLIRMELYQGFNIGESYWHLTRRQTEIYDLLKMRYFENRKSLTGC
jgi:hypothetical protein